MSAYQSRRAPLPAPPGPASERRRRPHRLLQFDLQVRVGILFAATITCLLAWFVPQSLTEILLAEGGDVGTVVLCLLTLATLIGYADVLINDLLPEPFSLSVVRHNRHLGYSLIAALYLLQSYVSVGESLGPEDLLPLGYALNALLAAWYSWTTAVRGWHAY